MNNERIISQFFVVSERPQRSFGFQDLVATEKGEKALQRLMGFKATERKDDPERRYGLHGPYEELVLKNTGRLPDDYYNEGDDAPWGLRLQESRSNILWQVLSGMLDHRPEFAAAYLGVALTSSLNVDEYSRELGGIHKSWSDYHSKKNIFNNHSHSALRGKMHSVSCPACSLLTAMVCQDEEMNHLFQRLIPMNHEERTYFMKEQGFAPLLNIEVPTPLIVIENHLKS